MKRILLLVALLPTLLFAQTPFGYHATWYYEFSDFGFEGYKKIAHVGDTTMLGLNWLTFEVTGLNQIRTGPGPNDLIQIPNASWPPMYLATRNDSVFRLLNDSTPYLLYDFSAQIGDSWQFAPLDTNYGCDSVPKATVLAIGYDTIAGQAVQYWDISNVMDSVSYGGGPPSYQCFSARCMHSRIYRNFGSGFYTTLFEAEPNLCNGAVIKAMWINYNYMRCFSDDSMNIQLTSKACDYWSLIGVEENELPDVKIYPNPSSGFVFIDTKSSIANVEVYNVSGQKLRSFQTEKTIELPQPAGLYFLHITFENGAVRVEKVVRE
jgi:hypothetical protein